VVINAFLKHIKDDLYGKLSLQLVTKSVLVQQQLYGQQWGKIYNTVWTNITIILLFFKIAWYIITFFYLRHYNLALFGEALRQRHLQRRAQISNLPN